MSFNIRLSQGLGQRPLSVPGVRSMVVEDNHGQPICVIMTMGDSSTLVATPGDSGFEQVLADLGFQKRCDYKVIK